MSFWIALACWGMAALAAVPTPHGIAAMIALVPMLWVLRITARREGTQTGDG